MENRGGQTTLGLGCSKSHHERGLIPGQGLKTLGEELGWNGQLWKPSGGGEEGGGQGHSQVENSKGSPWLFSVVEASISNHRVNRFTIGASESLGHRKLLESPRGQSETQKPGPVLPQRTFCLRGSSKHSEETAEKGPAGLGKEGGREMAPRPGARRPARPCPEEWPQLSFSPVSLWERGWKTAKSSSLFRRSRL